MYITFQSRPHLGRVSKTDGSRSSMELNKVSQDSELFVWFLSTCIGNGVVNSLISHSGQSDGACLGWLMTRTRLQTKVIPSHHDPGHDPRVSSTLQRWGLHCMSEADCKSSAWSRCWIACVKSLTIVCLSSGFEAKMAEV